MAKNTKANETTETNNVATTSNNVMTITVQSGPPPAASTVQHGGSRDGSVPAKIKAMKIGDWFTVPVKEGGKTNNSKSANIQVAAKRFGYAISRYRSEDGKNDVYIRVEAPAAESEAEKTDATE